MAWSIRSCTSSPAGLLTRKSTRAAAFPAFASGCPFSTQTARSLHTVTRSYRPFTCFPIIRTSRGGTAPNAFLYSIFLYHITLRQSAQPFFTPWASLPQSRCTNGRSPRSFPDGGGRDSRCNPCGHQHGLRSCRHTWVPADREDTSKIDS